MANSPPVLLFDGVCNLCNAAVDFIIVRDSSARFRFASLQSDVAKRLLHDADPERGDALASSLSTSIVVAEGRVYTKSAAALQIVRRLDGAWPVLYAFIVVPRFIRDWVYDVVGKNRYRWFGKKDTCRIPTDAEAARFLS